MRAFPLFGDAPQVKHSRHRTARIEGCKFLAPIFDTERPQNLSLQVLIALSQPPQCGFSFGVVPMADKYQAVNTTSGSVVKTLRDMGDGTFAEVVAGNTGTSASQVQGTAAGNAAASGNPVQVGGIYESTPSTYDNNDAVPLHTDSRGNLKAAIYNADGTNGVSVGAPNSDALAATANSLAIRSFGYVFNGTTLDRARGDTNGTYTVAKPVTSGGLSAARVVTDTTGVIKGSAGQLYKLHSVRNANAGVRYLHLYDKATAPTLSTDTPILTISLAASSVQNDVDIGGNIGVAFANGIAWAYTTDNVAIPTTAGTSTELMFSGAYK